MEKTTEKNPVEYLEPNPTEEEIEEQIKVIEKVNEAINEADKKIIHKWFAEDSPVQLYVQYAYEIWGMDLVTTIECENGTWNMYRQSTVVKNWKREESYWFCQISQVYHPEIVNTDEFWNNWRRQLEKCNELMKWWTAFYGRDRKIKWVKCSTYVKDRFILNV